jgi:uncharacterized membrane protein YfhO
MKHRIIAIILFAMSLIGILIGYFLLHPEIFISCPMTEYSNCISEFWSEGFASPLFWSTRWLPPLFFILIFVRREVFRAWSKVIVWVVVPALLAVFISPPLPTFLSPDRTQTTDFMVKFIVTISLAVILWKYWRLSRAKSTKPMKAT